MRFGLKVGGRVINFAGASEGSRDGRKFRVTPPAKRGGAWKKKRLEKKLQERNPERESEGNEKGWQRKAGHIIEKSGGEKKRRRENS